MPAKLYLIAFIFLLPVAAAADDARPLQQFIAHLETGERWDASLQPAEQSGFEEHSANMSRLRKQGTILFGARYGDYGLLILSAESLSSATEILDADPGVMAGIFRFRIEPISIFYPWKSPDQ